MKKIAALLCVVLLFFACKDSGRVLNIRGEIDNASGEMIYLSLLGAQDVLILDSVKLSSTGRFKFKVIPTEYPEFYFVNFANKGSVVILSDSVSDFVVKADMLDVIGTASVEGNIESQQIREMDRKMYDLRSAYERYKDDWEASADKQEKELLTDAMVTNIRDFKEEVGELIMKNPRSFVGYYLLYQRLDDTYTLFNPYDKDDFKYFGTLATSLNIFYPNAPRTKALYEKVEDAIKMQRKVRLEKMIEDAPSGLPDLEMPDVNGDTVLLSSLRGKVVLLNYWRSNHKVSRMNNRALKLLYNKYNKRGLEIYQCSLDKSKVLWEVALEEDGVDWLTFCDFKGVESRSTWLYNVTELPTNYLLDRHGDLVGKYVDPTELENKIKSLL